MEAQLNHVKLVKCGQAFVDMPNILQNNKTPISLERVESFCLGLSHFVYLVYAVKHLLKLLC